MEKKLIELHKEWMEAGNIKEKDGFSNGLCWLMGKYGYEEQMELFKPSIEEEQELRAEGFCPAYWASESTSDNKAERYIYSPLRQTIVLLICAMCDEL